MGKEQSFQLMVLGQLESFMQMENWIHTSQHKQVKSKCLKDYRSKTIKVLEENIGAIFCDIGFDNDYLDIKPKAQTKENIDELKFLECSG